MCSILLSIKPKYVEEILLGNKKYEYRTRIAKREVDKILIYCTNPVKRIVAEVEVLSVVSGEPTLLWKKQQITLGLKSLSIINISLEVKWHTHTNLGRLKSIMNLKNFHIMELVMHHNLSYI